MQQPPPWLLHISCVSCVSRSFSTSEVGRKMHSDRSRLEGCCRLVILRPEQNKGTLRPVGRMSTKPHKNDKNHKNALEFTSVRGVARGVVVQRLARRDTSSPYRAAYLPSLNRRQPVSCQSTPRGRGRPRQPVVWFGANDSILDFATVPVHADFVTHFELSIHLASC